LPLVKIRRLVILNAGFTQSKMMVCFMDKGSANEETLEESIFKTLSHQKRRDILRVIGEKGEASFTEIKNSAGIEDSPSLSYHLNALDELIVQKEGKYRLSELGHDAYNLIRKTAKYVASTSLISSLRKSIALAIVANAIIWAAAIFSVSQFEGRPHQTTISSFAALWFISNIIMYSILTKISK
jgi:DNA-binding transcriptional ArsR family regulator